METALVRFGGIDRKDTSFAALMAAHITEVPVTSSGLDEVIVDAIALFTGLLRSPTDTIAPLAMPLTDGP